jgi:N-acetylated-alpha-linked acidic dipeptidase
VLRLANAEVLPFRFQGLAENLQHYLRELQKLADDARAEADRINRMLDAGDFQLALDPLKTLTAPATKKVVPHFNFAPLMNAVADVDSAAKALDAELDQARPADLEALNRRLYLSERALTSKAGLPGRDWYRHQIYAPGFYTGYGVKTLPRVREAIEAEHYDEVDAEIVYTAEVLTGFANYLNQTLDLLDGEGGLSPEVGGP